MIQAKRDVVLHACRNEDILLCIWDTQPESPSYVTCVNDIICLALEYVMP